MRGRDVIKAILAERGISADEFFGRTRLAHVVEARRDAIEQMRALGMGRPLIARIMRRNESTINYWSIPGLRERRIGVYRRYWLTHTRPMRQARAA